MFRRTDPHFRFERTLLAITLTLIVAISTSAWWTLSSRQNTQQSREGLLQLVSNIRAHLSDGSLPASGYSDISSRLTELAIVPPVLQGKQGRLHTPWGTPLVVALNLDSALPTIEVTFKGLNYNACSRTIAGVAKGFSHNDDLRSIWIGPPGVILTHFPVPADETGCERVAQQVTFQFHLRPRS